LTLAAHLHRCGVSCRIIDRSDAPTDKSKALVLWPRSLEMLDDLGVVEDFLAAGMFANAANLYGGRRLLARIPVQAGGTHYPRPLMLAQSETERLLIGHLERAGVKVERSVEPVRLGSEEAGVTATLRHGNVAEETVRCDWLLGCDGAHSTVRKEAGLDFAGEAEPNDWVLADCRVDGPIPQDEISLFWHSKGVLAFFPFGPGRCRSIADMGLARNPGRPPDPSLAEMQAIVDERGPGGVRLSEPFWLSGFRIHERKVANYRRGRVFLAGDAAHIHSPAGGQGMNTGMQDAWNLAWKLGLVSSGRARASLLDSYTLERGEVGEMVLRNATRLTRVATLRNPISQFIRNRVVGLLGMLPAFRRGFVRTLNELAIHYPNSPLNGESAGAWASGSVRPGDRLPDVPVREPATGREERLLSVLRGVEHKLLLLPKGTDPADVSALAELGKRAEESWPGVVRVYLIAPAEATPGVTVWVDPSGSVRGLLGASEQAVAVVRPDGYLSYRAQPPSWEGLRAHLDRYLVARGG
jgi:2-polyprenyl-6-methoxyphenol hydroxylase-like FAD-dependent oxidoreductase